MQDAIIKGTGNSRYLRSVANFMALYPTYEDFAAALVAGTLPVDFNGINPTGWTQTGTPMNKANVLTDATAQSLGLTSAATPNEAFSVLSSKTALSGYDNDLFLYVTGQHPILSASPTNDYPYWRYLRVQNALARDIALSGDAETITVYDGG